MPPRPRLLVSVRDAAEALAALAGGADLIDVKEPDRGPLGRADDAVIAEVVRAVAGRVPVSAALGELGESIALPPVALEYVKWGLAGWEGRDWQSALDDAPPNAVFAGYADCDEVDSPLLHFVALKAASRRAAAFLIDTFVKDGRTLLDVVSAQYLGALLEFCRSAGVPVALAGSLDLAAIERLKPLRPDWFAVRGAACDGGRGGRVCADKVRRLREALE